ncbi:hypothetical protein AB0909_28500 [Streptomyces albidoflavus]|uniref:hypothetical protein n=1 Tax=Streptomyces albidoflavus TaxID=1886 RepID=UPI0034559E2A
MLVNTWTEDNDTDEAFEQWRERNKIIVQQGLDAGLGAPLPEDEPTPTPENAAGDAVIHEPTSSPGEHPEGQAQAPEPEDENTEGPTEQTPDPAGDAYGTLDLYDVFGLGKPEHAPAQAQQDEPESEEEGDAPAAVPDGQMTMEEVAAEPGPASVPQGPLADVEQQPERPGDNAARGDGRVRLTSVDGRLTFTLREVPADAGLVPQAVDGYQRQLAEFTAVVQAKNEQAAQTFAERSEQLARWRRRLEPFRPLPSLRLTPRREAPGLTPADYHTGSWVTWRDGRSGKQVTGQVMGPGPDARTWFVSTDRTGHTGEYHLLSRSGKKSSGYTYSLNGAATDLRPADGPGQQLPLEDLPVVDAVPSRPVASYADWLPPDTHYGRALAPVREPIEVTVGQVGTRFDAGEVAFDVAADGIPFVVKSDQNDETLTMRFVPRVESEGTVVAEFAPQDSRAEAVDFCVKVAREARELADKPLRAQNRHYAFELAGEGVCGRCSLHLDDSDVKPLYRVDGGDADCMSHLFLRFRANEEDVAALARARRIWAVRTAPETGTDETVAPAEAEQPAETPAEPETVAAVVSQGPRQVARETLQGGNRITAVVSGASIEWDGEAWAMPVPETATVTGTVYPGFRDYHVNAALLDAKILDRAGAELAATDRVFIRNLPTQVQVLPSEHRDDLRPETRTVAQVRLGDLIAEGGTRGEAVTELRFVDRDRRGSVMALSTRDVATGTGNGFALNLTDEVLVVPRERRAPQDVAAVFGRHGSHDEVAFETRRVYDLHAAVAEVTARLWPDGDTGPQEEIQALSESIGAIDAAARGADAYRSNAAAMEAAAAAAATLFAATDDATLTGYVGLPLHRLRQHLDVQAQRLHADVAHLTERAAATPTTAPSTAEEPTSPATEEQATRDQSAESTQGGEDSVSQSAGETEQLGLFGDPMQGPAEPETSTGSGSGPAEDRRGTQLQAALAEGETIAPVSFTDQRDPVAGWILTTAAGHTFRLRPVPHARPDEDHWEAGHDADGSSWWSANLEDRPLEAVLARLREDTAARTRFASLWAQYGHLAAQAPPFETTTDRVQLEEGVYLVRRFGRIGLVAECRWGWEHLTDPDGAQGRTGEDWSRKGPDNRQYVAEWKIWHAAQEAIPNSRLRVRAQLTDDMTDTPDAYCDASQPYVGKCSAKRSGARYTVAVVTEQEVELGRHTVCAGCLSHRLLNDEGRDVQSLAEALAKGDPKVGNLHWKQWPDRITEVAGQLLSAALDAGETAPWPAQALADQIIAEACEAGDDRAAREARASVKAAGGDTAAQKQAAEEAVAARQDRAALVDQHGEAPTGAANEAAPLEPSALPELDVVLLDVDVPPLGPAEPYDTDEEVKADIGRLGEAFARWDALPSVQRYYEADRQQRPDGAGTPANPVAQLAAAYRDAERSLHKGPAGSPDDLVRQVHTVAVWSSALEPVVGEDLRGPLAEMRNAAALLAARSRATVEVFEAELASLSVNPAEESPAAAPAEQGPADERETPVKTVEPGSGGPAVEPESREQRQEAVDDQAAAVRSVEDTAAPATEGTGRPSTSTGEPPNAEEPPAAEGVAADPSGPPQAPLGSASQQAAASPRRPERNTPQSLESEEPVSQTEAPAQPKSAAAPPVVEVEDPPEPRRYVDATPDPFDPAYTLNLYGQDGRGPDSAEVLHNGEVVATLTPTVGNQWSARLAPPSPQDVSPIDLVAVTAHRAAVLYSSRTGVPYGPPPSAAEGASPEDRGQVLRGELRDMARKHHRALTAALDQVLVDARPAVAPAAVLGGLDRLAAAVAVGHDAGQMAANLAAVRESATSLREVIAAQGTIETRRAMEYPVAQLLYDATRAQARLQATVEVAQREVARSEKTRDRPRERPREKPREKPREAPRETPRPGQGADTREAVPGAAAARDRGERTGTPAGQPPRGDGAATDRRRDRVRTEGRDAGAGQVADRKQRPPAQRAAEANSAPGAPDTPRAGTDLRVEPKPTRPADSEPAPFQARATAFEAAWKGVEEAWRGTVAPQGPPETVQERLAALRSCVAEAPAPLSLPSPARQEEGSWEQMMDAAAATPGVTDTPEWSGADKIRQALRDLLVALREAAGEAWERLRTRMSEGWRGLTATALEGVAGFAQRGADRLRGIGKDLPTAQALLDLGDTALRYSVPPPSDPPPAPRSAPKAAVPAPAPDPLEQLRQFTGADAPAPTASVSASAARSRSAGRRPARAPQAQPSVPAPAPRQPVPEQRPARTR